MHLMVDGVKSRPTRRRGAELEHALLSAAWAELSENGYAGFTMEAVALRAGTSTPVLYRRWPDRWDLALAGFGFYVEQHPVTVPDTGTLRGDLVAYLREVSAKRGEIAALFSLHMAEFFHEGDTSPARVRERFLEGRATSGASIYDRAVERGDIDPAALTPRRRTLALDLLRHELLMTLRPVPRRVIEQIVDDIVLPVLMGSPAGTTPGARRGGRLG